MSLRALGTFPLFLLLSILWTWPAVIAGDDFLIGRGYDALVTTWFLDAAPRILPSLQDPLTAWPTGASYARPDSWLALLIGQLSPWVSPGRLHAALLVLGMSSAGWAAEGCARSMGARRPWSLFAGLGFAFCGLTRSAALEGYTYQLLNLWMPLCLWCAWRILEGRSRWWDGAAVGSCFLLCLLSSAYLGLSCLLLTLGLLVEAWRRERLRTLPILTAVLVAGAGTLLYSAFFLSSVQDSSGQRQVQTWALRAAESSSHLGVLAGPSPAVDLLGNATTPALPATILMLALLAPVVLRSCSGWRVLWWTGLGSLVLSMGPHLGTPLEPLLPLPLSGIRWLPGHEFLRFPVRLAWCWVLCWSVIAARAATRLGERLPRHTGLLALAVLADLFGFLSLSKSQGTLSYSVGSAYAQSPPGAALDLFPSDGGSSDRLHNWTRRWSCVHQTLHERPIMENCIATRQLENPRWLLSQELHPLLLEGELEAARELLLNHQLAIVAWRPDLYRRSDRERLAESLKALFSEPQVSTDGGEHLWIYTVQP